jgi:hypothetical protein
LFITAGWGTLLYCGIWANINVDYTFCIITGIAGYFAGFTGSPMTTYALLTGMVYINGTAEEQVRSDEQ